MLACLHTRVLLINFIRSDEYTHQKAFSGNWTFQEDESEDECDNMDIEGTPQMEFYPFTSAEPFTATAFCGHSVTLLESRG
jgi:hypothetical protein